MYSDENLAQHRQKTLLKETFAALRDHWRARFEIMKQLPKNLEYYKICDILFSDYCDHDDSQMLGRHFINKRKEFYLQKAFEAIKTPYMRFKNITKRKNTVLTRRVFK